jgi:hypothetical protein
MLLGRFGETENKDRKIRKDILHTKKKEYKKRSLRLTLNLPKW